MGWKDDKTLHAVQFYFRLAVGAALVGVVLYCHLAGRIDIREVVSVITALLAVDRLGNALISHSRPSDNS